MNSGMIGAAVVFWLLRCDDIRTNRLTSAIPHEAMAKLIRACVESRFSCQRKKLSFQLQGRCFHACHAFVRAASFQSILPTERPSTTPGLKMTSLHTSLRQAVSYVTRGCGCCASVESASIRL